MKSILAKTAITSSIIARQLMDQLTALVNATEWKKDQRYCKEKVSGNKILGARFVGIFALASEFKEMKLLAIERLLDNPY